MRQYCVISCGGMINGKADKADSYENVYADFTAKFEKLFKKVEIPKVTTPKVEGD